MVPDRAGWWWFQDVNMYAPQPVLVWACDKWADDTGFGFEHPWTEGASVESTTDNRHARNCADFPDKWHGYCEPPEDAIPVRDDRYVQMERDDVRRTLRIIGLSMPVASEKQSCVRIIEADCNYWFFLDGDSNGKEYQYEYSFSFNAVEKMFHETIGRLTCQEWKKIDTLNLN
jgi:hypothetical protein